MIGKFVLVRTDTAGVHMGTLREANGSAIILHDARRLWQWHGAFSLNEISLHGCAEESRISEAVPQILLTGASEIIPCSEKARKNLTRSRNGV